MKNWSDETLLEYISNPTSKAYEVKIKNPEITFLGTKNQPDFANIYICLLYTSDAADE